MSHADSEARALTRATRGSLGPPSDAGLLSRLCGQGGALSCPARPKLPSACLRVSGTKTGPRYVTGTHGLHASRWQSCLPAWCPCGAGQDTGEGCPGRQGRPLEVAPPEGSLLLPEVSGSPRKSLFPEEFLECALDRDSVGDTRGRPRGRG